MNSSIVSIIIPTFKTNNSLRRAVFSCLNQTYKNIEVIVVDDNEPDSIFRQKAEKIMKEFSNNKKVKYIKHKKNMNGSAARNTGVRYSNGDIISFLDDDDYYLENKIELQVKKLNETDSDLCVCFYLRNNNVIKFREKTDYTYDVLMSYSAPQTSSFLIKKDFFEKINGFDESYYRHQDYEFLIRSCQKGKICVVKLPLYVLDNNGVNNVPDGEKLEKLKGKFLKDFDYLIIKKYNRKKIYARNYSLVFVAYLKSKKIKDSIRILINHFNLYFLYFLFYKFFRSIRFFIKGA